jgi:hypothetical protein
MSPLDIVLLVVLVALLIERRSTLRAHETERRLWFVEQGAGRGEREKVRHEHADQVQSLLNQIKPDTAQPVLPRDMTMLPPVDINSDEEFWESKDDLAERLMREEVQHG